jgi:sRNA-binding carbon storage regulator CsrA
MLHIQMQKGEYITIGDNIRIYCTKSSCGGAIAIGVEAPREMKVLRPKHAMEEELKLQLEMQMKAG